jgi:N-acetylglucosaminyldiphosphoundecaprenol N-acetyl-beta-D-mannosaminyltransferase
MPTNARTPAPQKPLDTVPIGGFNTVIATAAQFADRMVADCLAARANQKAGAPSTPKLAFSSNGQGVSLAGADPSFAEVMNTADFVHADGMSVVFASRLPGRKRLPERIATTDFFHDAAEAAMKADLSFYILGGSEAQNLGAYEAIRTLYPTLRLAGRRNGYFKREEDADVCAEIVAAGTDVLWVGLGKPLQERWSVENRERLAGVGWLKTCGGLYAFLAGEARRAPDWAQSMGLEWAWRMLQEPGRLAWRYFVTNPHAIYLMLTAGPPPARSANAEVNG